MSLDKADEFLQVAQYCLDRGWSSSAVSRAYFAMFHAAQAALGAVGVERPWWRHGALRAAFATELVQRRKLYPASFVDHVTEAMELRHMADYSDSQVPRRRALKVVRAAGEFVARVKEVGRHV